MSNIGSMIATSKINEVNSRINSRLSEISSQTGISFKGVFFDAMVSPETDPAAATDGVVSAGGADAGKMLAETALKAAEEGATQTELTDKLMAAYNARVARQSIEGTVSPTLHTASLPAGIKPEKYDDIITEVANRYGVNPLLVRAIAFNESSFRADIVSPNGATGLMALMPIAIEDLKVENPLDPRENVDGGVRALMSHIIRYDGDIKMALAAYNAGAGLLASRGIKDLDDPEQFAKLPAETRSYLKKIENYVMEYGGTNLLEANFFDKGAAV